jgi:hypothetical protein
MKLDGEKDLGSCNSVGRGARLQDERDHAEVISDLSAEGAHVAGAGDDSEFTRRQSQSQSRDIMFPKHGPVLLICYHLIAPNDQEVDFLIYHTIKHQHKQLSSHNSVNSIIRIIRSQLHHLTTIQIK